MEQQSLPPPSPPSALMQELQYRCHQLHESPSGSAWQREANSWLYAFTLAPEAWQVCVTFLGQPAYHKDSCMDFMVAKVLQLKIRQQWGECPAETQEVVQEALLNRLQNAAVSPESAPPVIRNQLLLALIYLTLNLLRTPSSTRQPVQLLTHMCQRLEVGYPLDFSRPLPILLVMEYLAGLPEEARSSTDDGSSDGDDDEDDEGEVEVGREETKSGVRRDAKEMDVVSQLKGARGWVLAVIQAVLEGCHMATGSGPGLSSELRSWTFRCLANWVTGGQSTKDRGDAGGGCGGWVSLEDLLATGMLATLERELKAGPTDAVGLSSYTMVLQVLSESLTVPSPRGEAMVRQGQPTAHRLQSCSAVWQVAAIIINLQSLISSVQDTTLSAIGCEIICTLLDRHSPAFWDAPFYAEARQACGVDSTLGESLLARLLDYAGHNDLTNVASWTLEVWDNLPHLMDIKASPHAARALQQILPGLVSVLHRQCTCPASLVQEEDWARALTGATVKLASGDVEDRLGELLNFRGEVLDTFENMVNKWPPGQIVGEYFAAQLCDLSRQGSDPRRVESALLGLQAVARAMLLEDEIADGQEDDEKGDNEAMDGVDRDRTLMGLWGPVLECLGKELLALPPSGLITGSVLVGELSLLIRASATSWAYERVLSFLGQAIVTPTSRLTASASLKRLAYSCRRRLSSGTWGSSGAKASEQMLTLLLTLSQQNELLRSLDSYANVVEAASVMGQAGYMLCAVLAQVEQGLILPLESVRLVRAGLKALKRDRPEGGQVLGALWTRIDTLICTPLQSQHGDDRVAASLADLLGVALETLGPADVVSFAAIILDKLAVYLGGRIWSAPLRTLTQLLTTLLSETAVGPQVWAAVAAVLDQVVKASAPALDHAKHEGQPLPTDYYESVFGLLKQVTQCPPLARPGGDTLWLGSGWELTLLAFETPLEDSKAIRAVTSYLGRLMSMSGQPASEVVTLLCNAAQHSHLRLLYALFRLASATSISFRAQRDLADALYQLLYGQDHHPSMTGLFQHGLLLLLQSKDNGLWANLEGERLEWAKIGFLTRHQARDDFRNYLRKFFAVCVHNQEDL